MHEIVRKIIPIQAAGSADGFRRGGVDTIRGSYSTCPPLPSTASRSIASTGLPAMRTYGVRKAFDREWVTKNAPRFAISAEQFRVTTPNMNTTSKTEPASISKIAPPQKPSVIEITRTSNLHVLPMARSACRSMPRHLSSSPNE